MNGTLSLNNQTNLQNKLLINVALGDAGLKVWILEKAQKKLVDQLEDRANSKRFYTIHRHNDVI